MAKDLQVTVCSQVSLSASSRVKSALPELSVLTPLSVDHPITPPFCQVSRHLERLPETFKVQHEEDQFGHLVKSVEGLRESTEERKRRRRRKLGVCHDLERSPETSEVQHKEDQIGHLVRRVKGAH